MNMRHSHIVVCVGDGRGDGWCCGDSWATGGGYGCSDDHLADGNGGLWDHTEGCGIEGNYQGNGHGRSEDGTSDGNGAGDEHEDYQP